MVFAGCKLEGNNSPLLSNSSHIIMDEKKIIHSTEINGTTLTFETGRLAALANGSVVVRYGETVVLATVAISEPREDIDFFPLFVEYEEKLYAGGLIKGSPWVKREGRPRDEAILNGRMIDRAIRPLFPKDFKNDVQVVVTVLSVDEENDPAVVGLVAASTALRLAGAPWAGPVAGVRVGRFEGEYIVNPGNESIMPNSDLDMIVASTSEKVLMLEIGAQQVPEPDVLAAIEFGHEANKKLISFINEFVAKCSVREVTYDVPEIDVDLVARIESHIDDNFDFVTNSQKDKRDAQEERNDFLTALFDQFEGKTTKSHMSSIFMGMRKKQMRSRILSEGVRADGRDVNTVRPLYIEVGLLPRTHGSGLFQRGDTQVLTITTLGSTSLKQSTESMFGEGSKRYIHHYNFPPYATGEVGRIGFTKRREIGHGALAERALEAVIPSEDEFPYTIRVVSEVLASNGSSSMASTCGSTLSLMDAGVPIKEVVSGIAMGLVTDGEGNYKILTDILGEEDMAGDMDFKVTGTKHGITAMQVDVKIDGLTIDMIGEIMERAHTGRIHILEQMLEVMSEPRKELSVYAPKVVTLKIDPEKIGEVIGSGGKVIKAIQQDTDTVIAIEEDGSVFISGIEQEKLDQARRIVEGITKEPIIGEVYDATVKKIMDFGAFVEYLPGKEGLVHVSEISNDFVDDVRSHLSEGQSVRVKLVAVDNQGRVNLSMKRATQLD